MNVRQALSSEKRFLSRRRGLNPQPSHDRRYTPTIEKSHRSSDGCGLHPRPGLTNRFPEDKA